jgi:sugar phosphate permease
LIWGSITAFFGIMVFIFLIDNPNSWFLQLTEEEKEIVEERTRDNAVVRKLTVKVSQYWEALKEPRLWILFVTSLTHNLQNGGLISPNPKRCLNCHIHSHCHLYSSQD